MTRVKRILRVMACVSLAVVQGAQAALSPLRTRAASATTVALPQRAEDRILVRFRPGISSVQRAGMLSQMGMRSQGNVNPLGIELLSVPPGKTPEQAIEDLKRAYGSQIEFAHVDHVWYASSTPNDTFFSSLYHLDITDTPEAWDQTTGSGITIAIADTGIDASHPDLSGRLVAGYNVAESNTVTQDQQGHGTFVAGVAAATGNNALDVVGAAYTASLMPIKIVVGGNDFSFDSVIAAGLVYAADHGAKVVNLSFGSDLCDSDTILDAAAYVKSKGGLVFQSSGNSHVNRGCTTTPQLITVSATNASDALASFSNFGAEIGVAAPGDSIISTNCDSCTLGSGLGEVAIGDGTSFASPLAAGIAALVYSIDQSFTSDQVQQILFDSADDLGTPGFDISFGWGRVNARRAVSTAQTRSAVFRLSTLADFYPYPNPWDVRRHQGLSIKFVNLPDGGSVKIFTLSGYLVRTLSPTGGTADWDLTNDKGQAVASGIYFYLGNSPTGAHSRGKLAIIR